MTKTYQVEFDFESTITCDTVYLGPTTPSAMAEPLQKHDSLHDSVSEMDQGSARDRAEGPLRDESSETKSVQNSRQSSCVSQQRNLALLSTLLSRVHQLRKVQAALSRTESKIINPRHIQLSRRDLLRQPLLWTMLRVSVNARASFEE